MRPLRFFLLPTIALLGLFPGCSSDDETPPTPGNTAGRGLAGGAGQAGGGPAGQAGAAGRGLAGGAGMAGAGADGGTAGQSAGGQSQGGAAGSGGAAGQGGAGTGGAAGQGGAAGSGGAGAGGVSGGAGQAGAGGSPSEQLISLYCGARAARVCQQFSACACPVPPDISLDDSLCRARVTASCAADFTSWRPAIDAGQVLFDAAAVLPCLDALDAWSSPCERARGLPPACLGVLSTAEPLGAPCSYPFCASGEGVCDGPGSNCRPLPQQGEPCAPACASPLVCVAGLCAVPVAEGAPCQADEACAPPLRCSAGACAKARPAGSSCPAADACEGGLACQSGACQKPAVPCDSDQDCGHLGHCVQPAKKRCQPPAPPGSPCGSSEECQPGANCDDVTRLCATSPAKGEPCAQGAYCALGLACHALDQVCVPVPAAGEPCAVGAESPFVCGAGFACVDGVCAAPPAEGKPCAGGNVCAAGLGCDFQPDGSFCVAPRAEGGSCQSDRVCQPGLHCSFESGTCSTDFPVGAACKDGNECGPAGTCVPDEVGSFHCRPRPAQGETCLFECQTGLACHAELFPRLCTADACSAVFQP